MFTTQPRKNSRFSKNLLCWTASSSLKLVNDTFIVCPMKLTACKARTSRADGNSDVVERGLSLLVTSLTLDFSHGRSLETEASMMAAIKAQDDRIGERGARCQWIWEHWQEDWIFRREFEVWG